MERFQERNQRSHFGWIQVLAVRRHVTAALNHLPHKLVMSHPGCDPVERGATLSSGAANRMAVAALFHLEDQRALALQWRAAVEVFHRDWIATPAIHDGTPGRIGSELGEGPERDGDEQQSDNGNGPPTPALLAFA